MTQNNAGLLSRFSCFKALEGTILNGASLAFETTGLSPEDRAFAKLIAHTTLKYFGEHCAIIESLAGKKRRIEDPVHLILNMALTQMRVLAVPEYAAISTSLSMAEKLGLSPAKSFLSGVLRNYTRTKENYTASDPQSNVPAWMLKAWKKHYGAEVATKIAASLKEEPRLDIVVKSNAEAWAQKLEGTMLNDLIIRRDFGGKISDLEGYAEGMWWVQDIAATLPVRAANPQPGQRILDLCAAPGGKTALLCHLGAHVTALDPSESRLERLRENMTRLGFDPEVIVHDGTTFTSDEPFDTILIDAPCSGTGVLRRHPDIAFTRRASDIAEMQKLQLALLENAAKLLKPKGKIVYSTCSLQKEEGEDVVWAFLRSHETFKQTPIAPQDYWGETLVTKQGALRTMPFFMVEQGGMDGFFIALLEENA